MNHGIILAAGASTRFCTRGTKILTPLLGKPMLQWVLEFSKTVPTHTDTVVVNGKDKHVPLWLKSHQAKARVAIQRQPQGTGHAVLCGLKSLAKASPKKDDWVVVLYGDVPNVKGDTIKNLIASAEDEECVGALLSMDVEQPKGYGRILRQENSPWVEAIVEEKDCSSSQRRICEINLGIYVFRYAFLQENLKKLKSKNAQGEYYLTDLVDTAWFAHGDYTPGMLVHKTEDPMEGLGINDRKQLHESSSGIQSQLIAKWMQKGVTFEQPSTVIIEPSVTLSKDCVIGPNVKLLGNTTLGEGVVLEGNHLIRDSKIRADTRVLWGTVADGAEVGAGSKVGPYARLRPGAELDAQVSIGNFVEVKNATIGQGTKAQHLSYIGDATVGKKVNIGCGFVACNYDGKKKNQTVIEDEVFVGSDSQTIAPLTLGKGCYVASGTTVTEDVPSGALVLGRVKQTVKPGYAQKLKK